MFNVLLWPRAPRLPFCASCPTEGREVDHIWALEGAAQGSGGVSIPVNVPKPRGCGTWGHGLNMGVLGLDDLGGVSQP